MNKNDLKDIFLKRTFIVIAFQILCICGLMGRLYFLQVKFNEHYQKLSDKNRLRSIPLVPERGDILDRTGQVLATNQPAYHATFNPYLTQDKKKLIEEFGQIMGLSLKEIEKLSLKNQRGFIRLKENLQWDDLAKIQLHMIDLPGLWLEKSHKRYYPYPEICSHFMGYVSSPTKKEIEENNLLSFPGVVIGKQGIEKTQEESLKGFPGFKQVEVNARGHTVRELEEFSCVKGNTVHLAIHLELQKYVYERLLEVGTGACVVMDNHTGEILAFVSVPGYDINLFTNKISHKDWQNLTQNPYYPLLNKVTSGVYPPGSVFKPIVALAALESGLVPLNKSFTCSGKLSLGNHHFHCWKKTGHGPISMVAALRESCDVYFYHVAAIVGVDAIAEMAKRFGFHQKTGVELSYEKAGVVPTKSWKRLFLGKSWLPGETYHTGIGQGYVSTTLLQLALMTARLTNGGYVLKPTFLKTHENINQTKEKISLDEDYLKAVVEGMVQAVNHPSGTSYNARIFEQGMEMGGKTGTAQVRSISKKEREAGKTDSRNWAWRQRDHAFFVGFAPIQNPRYVVAVLNEHGASGGRVSAPVGRDILKMTQILMKKEQGNYKVPCSSSALTD